MQREAKRGRLAHAKVPVRYHRKPLPIPYILRVTPVMQWLAQRKLPTKIKKAIQYSLDRGAQMFVFVSRIKYVEPLVSLLQTTFNSHEVSGTSSEDALRNDKVKQFREKQIRILVTTTILERGVTIPKSDVYITDADNSLFDAAALIQMAGRAGRSHADPTGLVYFCSASRTNSQKAAIHQLKTMNSWALKCGYLDKGEN
jgi:competence protein ComFA